MLICQAGKCRYCEEIDIGYDTGVGKWMADMPHGCLRIIFALQRDGLAVPAQLEECGPKMHDKVELKQR